MKEFTPERTPKPTSWYERSQTPESFRDLEPFPWASTPLHPHSNHQRMIGLEIEKLFLNPYPENIPMEFQGIVYTDFLSGRANRETMNQAHFDAWLKSDTSEGHGAVAHEVMQRCEEVGIESSKLLDFICENTIQATELAKLSVPYGYRIEYIPELRAEIDRIIIDRGGILLLDQPYRHIHVTPYRHPENMRNLYGILATYQRDVGRIQADDGTRIIVTERQALGIRTDELSGFPRDLYDKLTDGQIEISKETEDEIEGLIQADTNQEFMVPLSLTVFAHREKPEIRNAREQELKQKNHTVIQHIHLGALAAKDTTETK